jgi:hypothetical protein
VADPCRIPLGHGVFALVDAEDFELVQGYEWRPLVARSGQVYAVSKRAREGGRVLMHRLISGASKDQVTDHRDWDGLNNQRSNLRTCFQRQNLQSMTRSQRQRRGLCKGVTLDKRRGTWSATIKVGVPGTKGFGKAVFLGSFATEEQAARAYDEAARRYFGAFAAVNFSEPAPLTGRRLRGHGNYRCGRCAATGHTARSCPVQRAEPSANDAEAAASGGQP